MKLVHDQSLDLHIPRFGLRGASAGLLSRLATGTGCYNGPLWTHYTNENNIFKSGGGAFSTRQVTKTPVFIPKTYARVNI